MVRLIRADIKATVSQIHNRFLMFWSTEKHHYISRRPSRVPLRSAKNGVATGIDSPILDN